VKIYGEDAENVQRMRVNQNIMKNLLIKFKKGVQFLVLGGYMVIGRIILAITEVIFPKRVSRSKSVMQTQAYVPNSYADTTYFLKYKDPGVKYTLWQFKYYLNPKSLLWCTYILYDELISEASDRVGTIPFNNPLPLLHCPSSTYFKGAKNFDHMKELTERFGSLQNADAPFFICCTHAILPKATSAAASRAQHTGSRKERLEWAEQRFFISERFEQYLREKTSTTTEVQTVYCIDDVVTTGASLGAISVLLKKKFDVEVKSFCLCH
jgi:hypothetical protein